MATVSYPYDPSGLSPANLVVNEKQVLTAINNDPFRYFIPDFAPFYEVNFTATAFNSLGAKVTLRRDIDFHFSLKYIGATRANGKMTVGGVAIINKNIQGPVTLTYQTVGGPWAANRNYVIQAIAENNYNPRRVAWDQVTNVPDAFPPNDHAQDLDTFTGLRDLIDAMGRLTDACVNPDTIRNELRAHILNKNDPHDTMFHLPKTLIHRSEFEAHTKNLSDPHKTISILPSDVIRRTDLNTAIAPLATKTELTAHTSNFNDPHKTLNLLPQDLVTQQSLLSQFDSRNEYLTAVPTSFKTDVIYVTEPHMRCMVWDRKTNKYDRAPWHRPGLLTYSYVNPTAILGYLLVSPSLEYRQADYPDLAKALGLSGVGVFRLIELRGNFLRILDNGRGKDLNRANLSFQAGAVMAHNHYLPTSAGGEGEAWALLDSGVGVGKGSHGGDAYSPWTQTAVNVIPKSGTASATTYPNPIFVGDPPSGTYKPLEVGNVGKFAADNLVDNTAVSLWISY